MSQITFDTRLELGAPEVDAQHRELVALYNEACLALEKGDSSSRFVQILNHLQQFAVAHCSAEELLMEEIGYPQLEQHRQAHSRTVEQVMAVDAAALLGDGEEARALMQVLRAWVLDHIRDDLALAAFLRARG